ncbi:MAG: hypothetical protein RSE12_14490 [Fuscovulum sp.]|nr:MAG: hypothetical protein RSE12_14490 [Fuscovulum sp.]
MTAPKLPNGFLDAQDAIDYACDLARLITECDHAGAAAAAVTIADRLDFAKANLAAAAAQMSEAKQKTAA